MKTRALSARLFGTCLFIALTPVVALAQPGGGTGGGGTTGGGTGAGGSTTTTSAQGLKAPAITLVSPSSGAGSATTIPSSTNPFVASYGDALSMGLPSKFLNGPVKDTVTFGKGIYSTTTTATAASGASTITNPANGFTLNGIIRNPQYVTAVSSDIPMVVHNPAALQADVKSTIGRSSFVQSQATVQVNAANDGVIVLVGQVASEREFRLIEGMARTTPGVRDVLNELKIVPTK
jgi:hypothetical protein